MFSYQQVELQHLPVDQQQAFSPLLSPNPQHFFYAENKDHPIAWAAFRQDRVVGIIIGYTYPILKEAFIRHGYVLEDFRHQGIGHELMNKILTSFQSQNIKIVECKFKDWEPWSKDLEKILKKTGWSNPQVLTKRYYFDPHSFNPKWFSSAHPLRSPNFSIFDWTTVKPEELMQVQIWVKNNPILEHYSPLDQEKPMEPLNSLGLRFKDELAGWIITHRVDDALRYSALYVHPEIRGLGPALALLKESIRRHISDAPDRLGFMEINQRFAPRHWMHFVQKRLAPFAIKIENVMSSHIILED